MTEPAATLSSESPPRARPRVFVFSYSEVSRDARVQRQAEYLSDDFDVVLVGWGSPPPVAQLPGVTWHAIPSARSRLRRLATHALLAAGRLLPPAYAVWHRLRPGYRQALEIATTEPCDVFYANDWFALPVAAAGAAASNGRLVLDAHEYAPLELESSWLWRMLYRPLVLRVLAEYASRCTAWVTVSRPIAERYASEYRVKPLVVLNAPAIRDPDTVARQVVRPIRLIHLGNAMRERRIERMIEAVAIAQGSCHLDLMLVGDQRYIAQLKAYAAERAPERIAFRAPVPPSRIVQTLQEYDVGLYLLDSDIFNHAMAMPNKFFDFVAAGLAVCIGPSPAMREIVEEYQMGIVCRSTEPAACAAALDSLSPGTVQRLKDGARIARRSINADVEMQKLVALIHRVVAD